MNAEALRNFLRAQPFLPLEIHMSDGQVHRINHPECSMVTGSRLYVYEQDSDRVIVCSLLHISSVQFQEPAMS